MPATTKKVFLFLVEGPSDAASLENIIQQLLRSSEICFQVLGTDITTIKQRAGCSIKTAVNEVVCRFMNSYRLRPEDMLGVAHLMDTDGAFVPLSAISEDKNADKFRYSTSTISAKSIQDVVDRNALKRAQMLCLAHMGTTYRRIPYKAYFCSRNLEHVLHDITENCTKSEKLQLADDFHHRFCDRPKDFVSFISTVPPAVPVNEYGKSWEYISAEGTLHSLERGSNLHILLQEILGKFGDNGEP